jgi:hypothetical protein
MPFDPKVTVLPPTLTPPPERRDGRWPVHIVINIDATAPRRPPRSRASFAAIILRLILVAAALSVLLGGAGHAERWQDNRVGSTTYWQNLDTGVRGQERLMPDGSVRSEWQDPRGHVTRCVVQAFGPALSRECR